MHGSWVSYGVPLQIVFFYLVLLSPSSRVLWFCQMIILSDWWPWVLVLSEMVVSACHFCKSYIVSLQETFSGLIVENDMSNYMSGLINWV